MRISNLRTYNFIIVFIVLIVTQFYLINHTGLTADEPSLNLKSFNEVKYILNQESVPLGTDVLHQNTFQNFGSTIGCLSNLGNCMNLFMNLDDKKLFWSIYDDFLIDVRLILIPLSLFGQLSLLFAARLMTRQKRFELITLPIVGIYPIWLSHSAFNFSDFIPLVGFCVLIYTLTAFYFIDDFHDNKSVRIALNPWLLFSSFIIVAGSRFPLIYIALLSFLISFTPNFKRYFNYINWKTLIFPFIFYLTVFVITNIRFVFDLPTSLLRSLGLSADFEVGLGAQVFVFSRFYESASPPVWYIGFNNFARIPIIYLILTLLSFYFIYKLLSTKEKRSYLFIASLSIIILFPLSFAAIVNSPSYDTARHFYFIHSVILFLSLISFMKLLEYFKKHGSFLPRITSGIVLILFILVIIDESLLKTKTYVYRNEFVRLLGVNVMESDYWASNRVELSRFVGDNSSPVLIKSQWYQNDVRLFFSNYTYAESIEQAVLVSNVEKKLFIYRSSLPSSFSKLELEYPNCKIIYTTSSKMLLQDIVDGRVYQC
jgi:hypothetical protein